MTSHILVIAEKPSVAQTIAAVLGAKEKKDGFLTGNSNARIYRIRWRFCCLYVSYSSIFIPIQHFSRLI